MFEAIRFEENLNIYMIVKKSDLKDDMFTELPFKVYGFLKVKGNSYYNSIVELRNISDEVHDYLKALEEEVKLDYFQVD